MVAYCRQHTFDLVIAPLGDGQIDHPFTDQHHRRRPRQLTAGPAPGGKGDPLKRTAVIPTLQS